MAQLYSRPASITAIKEITSTRDAAVEAVRRIERAGGIMSETDIRAIGGFFRAVGVGRAVFRFEGGGRREDFRGIDTYSANGPEENALVLPFVGQVANAVASEGPSLNTVLQTGSVPIHLGSVGGGGLIFDVLDGPGGGHTEVRVVVEHKRSTNC